MPSFRQRVALVSAGAAVVMTGLTAVMTTGASAVGTRYEAESAPATCDGVIASNHAGYSGSGFCNGDNAVGAGAQFTATASAAGTATLMVRCANGTTANRAADVLVNGVVAHPAAAFNGTGAWATWITMTLTVSVDSGSNTIRLNPTTANGLPNIDYLELEVNVSPSATASPPPGRLLAVPVDGDLHHTHQPMRRLSN